MGRSAARVKREGLDVLEVWRLGSAVGQVSDRTVKPKQVRTAADDLQGQVGGVIVSSGFDEADGRGDTTAWTT